MKRRRTPLGLGPAILAVFQVLLQSCRSQGESATWRVVGERAVVIIDDDDSIISAREEAVSEHPWYFLYPNVDLARFNRVQVGINSSCSCDETRLSGSLPDIMLRCKVLDDVAAFDKECAGSSSEGQQGLTLGLLDFLDICSSRAHNISLDQHDGWTHLEQGAAARACHMMAFTFCKDTSLLIRGNFFQSLETTSVTSFKFFYEGPDQGAEDSTVQIEPAGFQVEGRRRQEEIWSDMISRDGSEVGDEGNEGQCHCFEWRDLTNRVIARSFILALVEELFLMATPTSVQALPAVTTVGKRRRRTWYISNGLFVIDAPHHAKLSLPVSLIHESKLATFVDDLNLLTTVSSPPHTRESQTLSLSCLDESELQTPNAVRAGHLLEDFLRRRKEDQSDEEVRGERRAGASASGESIVELWRKRKQNAVKMMEIQKANLQTKIRKVAIEKDLVFEMVSFSLAIGFSNTTLFVLEVQNPEMTIIPIEDISAIKSDHETKVEILSEDRSLARLNLGGFDDQDLSAFHKTLQKLCNRSKTVNVMELESNPSLQWNDVDTSKCDDAESADMMSDLAACIAHSFVSNTTLSSSPVCNNLVLLQSVSFQFCVFAERSSIALVLDAVVLIKYSQNLQPESIFCLPVREIFVKYDDNGVSLIHEQQNIHLSLSALNENYQLQRLVVHLEELRKQNEGKKEEAASEKLEHSSLFRSTGFANEGERNEFSKVRSDVLSCIGLEEEQRRSGQGRWLSIISTEDSCLALSSVDVVYCVRNKRRCCKLDELSSLIADTNKVDMMYLLQTSGSEKGEAYQDMCTCNFTVNGGNFHYSDLRKFFDLVTDISNVTMVMKGDQNKHGFGAEDVLIAAVKKSRRLPSSEKTSCQDTINMINDMDWNVSTSLLMNARLHPAAKKSLQIVITQSESCKEQIPFTHISQNASEQVSELLDTSLSVEMQIIGDHQILMLYKTLLVFINLEHSAELKVISLVELTDIGIDNDKKTFDFLSNHLLVFRISFLRFQPQRLYLFLHNLRSSMRNLQLSEANMDIPPSLRTSELLDFLRRLDVSEERQRYTRRREVTSAWRRCQEKMRKRREEEGKEILSFFPSRKRLLGLSRREMFVVLQEDCDGSEVSMHRFELAEVTTLEKRKGAMVLKNVGGDALVMIEDDEYDEDERLRLFSVFADRQFVRVTEERKGKEKEEGNGGSEDGFQDIRVQPEQAGDVSERSKPVSSQHEITGLLEAHVRGRSHTNTLITDSAAMSLLDQQVLIVNMTDGGVEEILYEDVELVNVDGDIFAICKRAEKDTERRSSFEIHVREHNTAALTRMFGELAERIEQTKRLKHIQMIDERAIQEEERNQQQSNIVDRSRVIELVRKNVKEYTSSLYELMGKDGEMLFCTASAMYWIKYDKENFQTKSFNISDIHAITNVGQQEILMFRSEDKPIFQVNHSSFEASEINRFISTLFTHKKNKIYK